MLNPIDSIINPSFVERGTFSISPDKSFKYPQNGLEFSNEFFINVGKISLQNVLGPLSRTFEATAHEEIVVSQCCLRFTDQVFHRKKMGISFQLLNTIWSSNLHWKNPLMPSIWSRDFVWIWLKLWRHLWSFFYWGLSLVQVSSSYHIRKLRFQRNEAVSDSKVKVLKIFLITQN